MVSEPSSNERMIYSKIVKMLRCLFSREKITLVNHSFLHDGSTNTMIQNYLTTNVKRWR